MKDEYDMNEKGNKCEDLSKYFRIEFFQNNNKKPNPAEDVRCCRRCLFNRKVEILLDNSLTHLIQFINIFLLLGSN